MTESLVRLVALADLAEGGMLAVQAGAVPVLLCKVEGRVHALMNRCTHGLAPLSDGQLKGHVIICPLHQGRFDIRNGSCVQAPPTRPLQTFDVRIHDEQIHIVTPVLPPAPKQFGPLG